MGLHPIRVNESRCHPERSEGSAVPDRGELMQILRFAQTHRLSGESVAAFRPRVPSRAVGL